MRALLVVVALVALWGIALRFLLPGVLRDTIAEQLSGLTGRPASVERIEIQPYAMVFRLHGLNLGEQADGTGGAPARSHARFALLEADLSWRSFRHFEPVLDRLKVDEPVLFVARDAAGVYDGADVLARLTAPGPEAPKPGSPPRFSVANIELSGGSIGLDDRKLDVRHAATGIALRVPFVSSLPVHQSIEVEPGLEATIDGAPIRATGQMLPFAAERTGELTVTLESFDLPHLPEPLPVKLVSAALASELTLGFSAPESGPAKLTIRGRGALGGVEVREPDDRPPVKLPAVEAADIELDLFAPRLSIGRLAIQRPEIQVVRRAGDARFLERVLRALERGAQKSAGAAGAGEVAGGQAGAEQVAGTQQAGGAGSQQAGTQGAGFAWSIGEIALTDGRWMVDDGNFSPKPLRVELADVAIKVNGLASPQPQPAQVKLSARGSDGEALAGSAQLTIAPIAFDGEVSLSGVPVPRWAWLAGTALALTVREGSLSVATRYQVRENAGGAFDWRLTEGNLRLESLALAEGEREVVRIGGLDVQRVAVDPSTRRVAAGAVTLDGGRLALRRDARGAIDAASWWRVGPQAEPAAAGESAEPSESLGSPAIEEKAATAEAGEASGAAAWQVSVDRLAVAGTEASLEHERVPGPRVAPLRLSGITVEASGLATDSKEPAPVSLAAEVDKDGRLSARGTVVPTTGALELSLQARSLPLPAAQPWLPSGLKARLVRGALSADGRLAMSFDGGAPRGRWQGAIAIADLNARLRREAAAAIPAEMVRAGVDPADLLSWKLLKLSATKVELAPLAVDLGDVELTGLRSRLVIQPDGRFNLQDLMGGGRSEAEKGQRSEAEKVQRGEAAQGQRDAASSAKSAPLPLRIGRITVAEGNVDFSDYFIKPNYSANLTGLAGSVGEMRAGQPAELQLDGRVDNTGALKIAGRIDPIGEPLFLDIRAVAEDLDLPTLSPYSGKYVGYGIEKGKLSATVEYKVENGQLTGENRIVLDQLTFGEPVESPDALKLPVLFAVSLLKDRNGVIDVQLPISGSLDDPQFSVAGIVMRIIGNLIVRAVTAPFALIGGLVGGSGEELSSLEFAPASAALDDASRERLATLAKALTERPGLKLDISGRSTTADSDALRKAEVEAQLKVLKRELAGPAMSREPITPAERPALLEQAWLMARGSQPPSKERPSAEAMESELVAAVPVPEAALREIANRRAQAVKDWLASEGAIDPSRLFVTAPKPAAEAAPGAEGKLAVGVQLTLR